MYASKRFRTMKILCIFMFTGLPFGLLNGRYTFTLFKRIHQHVGGAFLPTKPQFDGSVLQCLVGCSTTPACMVGLFMEESRLCTFVENAFLVLRNVSQTYQIFIVPVSSLIFHSFDYN